MIITQLPIGAEEAKSWTDGGVSPLLFLIVIVFAGLIWWLLKQYTDTLKEKNSALDKQISFLNENLNEKERVNQIGQLKYEGMLREQLTSYGVVMNGYEDVIKQLSQLPKEIISGIMPPLEAVKRDLMDRMNALPVDNKKEISPVIREGIQELKDLSRK